MARWRGSQAAHRALTWFTLLLGSFQRFRACAQQDPCQALVNTVGPGAAARSGVGIFETLPVIYEYLYCIRQDAYCQDGAPFPCSEHDCDAEFDLTSLLYAWHPSSSEFPLFAQPRMLSVSSVCPSTCQVCGPSKNQRQVTPSKAAMLRGPCGQGWSYADGACFKYAFGGQDGVQHIMLNWSRAEDSCQDKGAHLATVTTKAQEHLVFELIRNRPAHLGALGLLAWIGLWTGPTACTTDSSNWTWIGSQQRVSMPRSSFQPDCADSPHEAHAMYSNSDGRGETCTFSSFAARKKRRAWICSKPALFHPVRGGLCQDVGLLPILERGACEAAAHVLLGVDVLARRVNEGNTAFGCRMHSAKSLLIWNTEPASQSVRALPQTLLLCQPNTTGQMLTDPDVGLIGQWEGVHAGNASPSFSLPVIAAILAASFLPVSVVLAVQRQRLLSLTVRMLVLVSSLHKCVLRRETGEADHFIMVAERLQQWRRTGISIAAVVVASFHLFELVRICFVADSVCMCDSSLSHLRLFLALVHLCNLWVASLFLALTHWFRWKGSCPDLTFLFVITVLDIAWTGLLGEQALLVESRLYRQVLWRLLLGACTSPIIALLGNLLCVLGAGTVYKVLIPDGFIFTVGSTRAGLLYSQGCNQLWSKRDAMVGKELLQDLSRFSDVMDLSTLPHLSALLDELLKKQTSFTDFLLSEVILCTIVMVALMCLDALMSQGISQSLRLESSEDQLLAVSQILDRLCDATCQLSGELQICSCSPKLGAILHMSSTAWRAIEGMDFCSLIPSGDDLARFRTFVDQGIRDGFQEALVLKLKGASGIKVRMQLLCAKFQDVLGRPRVLCGLTELQVNGNSGNVQDATDSYGPLVGPSSSRTARQRRRGSRSPGSSSGSGGGSGAESEESCAAVVRLAEDAAVLHANGAFLQFLGTMLAPFRAGGFQQFLAEPAVFAESVRSCAEGASSGGLEEPSAREIGVTFNVLAAESGHVLSRPSKAVCRVECCKSPEGDSITAKLEVLTATPPVSSSALARGSRSSRAERSGQEQRGADIAPLEAATKEPSPSIMGRTAL